MKPKSNFTEKSVIDSLERMRKELKRQPGARLIGFYPEYAVISSPLTPRERYKARRPDWHGIAFKRFRWTRLRYQYGRYCYVIDPMALKDYIWWEWL